MKGKTSLRLCLFSFVILIAFLFQSCGEVFDKPGGVETEETVTISGLVLDASSSQPIKNAFVEITSPSENQKSTTTDSTGAYSFTLQTIISTQVSIKASKQDFETVTKTITVTPGGDFTGVDLALPSTDGDNGGVGGDPKGAAAIVLTNAPLQAINIAETGDIVSAPFTFVVQDSAGRALDAESSVEVQFKIVSGPGGGESLVPAVATTDAQGKVTTTLFSGNKAGPVKIQASVERPEIGLTIVSSPVLIAIHGGFPDAEHFSISANKFNFEGYDINNRRNTITVVLGDKFSNPVKPGTVVYFETTGGIIQGSATTDEDGIASVELISGDPRPSNGKATITATTVNGNNVRISKDIEIIFSTSHANISGPASFNIASQGGSTTIEYTVIDENGNPMAAGTTIKIEAGGGIELTGDASFILGDFRTAGPNKTEFTVTIHDADPESRNANPADTTIKIIVTTPSGSITTHTIQGKVQ